MCIKEVKVLGLDNSIPTIKRQWAYPREECIGSTEDVVYAVNPIDNAESMNCGILSTLHMISNIYLSMKVFEDQVQFMVQIDFPFFKRDLRIALPLSLASSGNKVPRVVQMNHSWKNISLIWKLISLW